LIPSQQQLNEVGVSCTATMEPCHNGTFNNPADGMGMDSGAHGHHSPPTASSSTAATGGASSSYSSEGPSSSSAALLHNTIRIVLSLLLVIVVASLAWHLYRRGRRGSKRGDVASAAKLSSQAIAADNRDVDVEMGTKKARGQDGASETEADEEFVELGAQ
jgi:hypothetical protein